MSLIRRAFERRSTSAATAEFGNSVPPTNGQIGGSVAGTSVSEMTALQVAAVYGSVGVISDAVATLPLMLVNSKEAAKRKRLPPSRLLTEPYAEIELTDWWVQFTMSLALRGNFYGEIIERDKEGYAQQIKPIHPDNASVRRIPDGNIEYRFNGKPVANQNVFHVRYLTVAGALRGLNPIEYLRNSLGLARAQDMYGSSWFQNSAIPSGVLEVEDDLDDDEVLALARQWMSTHQGLNQANLPAVLTGGTQFKAISITPEDSQFLESRQFSQGEICGMLFRVPPHMVGIVDRSTSWGRGIEQQETGFVRNTLAGYLVRGERALTALHPPNQFVEFDIGQRMRGDKLERYQAYSLGMLGGWEFADEIRAEEGKPPLPEGIGQTVLAPINTEPLTAMLEKVKAETELKEKEAEQPLLTEAPTNGNSKTVKKKVKKAVAASNGNGKAPLPSKE